MAREIDLDRLGIAVAGLVVAAALALLTAPGAEVLLPGPIRALDELPADGVAALVALVLAIVAGIGLIRRRPGRSAAAGGADAASDSGDEEEDRDTDDPGERRRGGRTDDARTSPRVVGQRATERHERWIERLRSQSGCPEPKAPTRLRTVAIELEQHRGHDEAARDRVEAGTWTTDPIAAAFLGGPEAGELSLRRRLYGAVYPARAYERRFERTLRELERIAAETIGPGGRTADPGTTERDRRRESEPEEDEEKQNAAEAADETFDGTTDASAGSRTGDRAKRDDSAERDGPSGRDDAVEGDETVERDVDGVA